MSRVKSISRTVRESIDPALFKKWIYGEGELTHEEWNIINDACCRAYNEFTNGPDGINANTR